MHDTDRNLYLHTDSADAFPSPEPNPDALRAEQLRQRRQHLLATISRAVSLREVEQAVRNLRPQVQRLS